MPAPTAAYAVPLSLVSAVLLVAGGLGLYQRRKLREERGEEKERIGGRERKKTRERGFDTSSGDYDGDRDCFTRFPGMRRMRTRMGQGWGSESICSTSGTGMACALNSNSRASTPTTSGAGTYRQRGDEMKEEGEDGASLYSVASVRRQPVVRRVTRGPWRGEDASGRMTAGVFSVSSVPPVLSRVKSSETDWTVKETYNDPQGCGGEGSQVCRQGGEEMETEREREKVVDASVEDALVEWYFQQSLVSPSDRNEQGPLEEGMGATVTAPEKLHVRRCTKRSGLIENMLPYSPKSAR